MTEPARRMVIELNEATSQALDRRQIAEKLNASTLFNRAMQVYDLVMLTQTVDGKLVINGEVVKIS